MKINTLRFGEVEVDENKILYFNEGIPGFEDVKRFAVLDNEENSSFKWLQAVDQPHPALPITNPFNLKQDYEFEVDETTKSNLDLTSTDEIAVFATISIPDNVTRMSTNLKAPIVVNTSNNKACQVVLHNSTYSTRHYILDEMVTDFFSRFNTSENTTTAENAYR